MSLFKICFFLGCLLGSLFQNSSWADSPFKAPIIQQQEFSEEKDVVGKQLVLLDQLIAVTQENLEKQKALQKAILEYQKLQDLYLQNPNDNEVLFCMVKVAHRLLEGIKANYLTQTFDKDFLSELTVFSQVANKRGIPKP